MSKLIDNVLADVEDYCSTKVAGLSQNDYREVLEKMMNILEVWLMRSYYTKGE